MITFLIFIHITCCFLMTGVIWCIQLVHYPSFHWINPRKFTSFVQFHGQRISIIVMPLMILELFTAGLFLFTIKSIPYVYLGLNLTSVLLIWLSTFFLSVPCHHRLGQAYDKATIDRLIQTNWPRTIIWTLRSFAIIGYICKIGF